MSIELKIDIKNNLKGQIQKIRNEIKNLPQEAYKVFKDNTPIKTGYAKKNTKLKKDTITADYSYAKVLDKGRHMTSRGMRGSEQAPNGMSQPTEQFIKKRLKQILKGK